MSQLRIWLLTLATNNNMCRSPRTFMHSQTVAFDSTFRRYLQIFFNFAIIFSSCQKLSAFGFERIASILPNILPIFESLIFICHQFPSVLSNNRKGFWRAKFLRFHTKLLIFPLFKLSFSRNMPHMSLLWTLMSCSACSKHALSSSKIHLGLEINAVVTNRYKYNSVNKICSRIISC